MVRIIGAIPADPERTFRFCQILIWETPLLAFTRKNDWVCVRSFRKHRLPLAPCVDQIRVRLP